MSDLKLEERRRDRDGDSIIPKSEKRVRTEAAASDERIGHCYSLTRSTLPSLPMFCASLKTLFSDFVVRERSSKVASGQPLRLTSFAFEQSGKPHDKHSGSSSYSPEEVESIKSAFAAFVSNEDLANLSLLLNGEMTKIVLSPVTDKAKRGAIHQAVKAHLGRTHISSSNNGELSIEKASQTQFREQTRRSQASNPQAQMFTHFTLYKENLDSANALRMMAQQLHVPVKGLLFSGTKDKRAVTLQRVACKGLDPSKLGKINIGSFGRNAIVKVGNFELRPEGLSLGDLAGNSFEIVLRLVRPSECQHVDASPAVCEGAENLITDVLADPKLLDAHVAQIEATIRQNGFVNFFGPQRFGTTSVLTSDVGRALLAGNFKEAMLLVLKSKCDVSPELGAALEKLTEEGSNDSAREALPLVPHYCYAERDMIRHLVECPGDYRGCFFAIQRTMAMLYFHSVQSLVWNMMASQRLIQQGPTPVVGDLVAVARTDTAQINSVDDHDVVGGDDVSGQQEDQQVAVVDNASDAKLIRVKRLTSEDVSSGTYSISDVLLTVPGADVNVQYPECVSASKSAYLEMLRTLGCENLIADPNGLVKQYHFHGTYRLLVIKPDDFSLEAKWASDMREQVLMTDLQIVKAARLAQRSGPISAEVPVDCAPAVAPVDSNPEGTEAEAAALDGHAIKAQRVPVVIARFGLPPGAYATSLLREFCIAVKE